MIKSNQAIRSVFILIFSTLFFQTFAQQIQDKIRPYLRENMSKWNLTESDVSNFDISDQYTNAGTGVTHVYLNQTVEGIRIFNAISAVALKDNEVKYFANRFQASASSKVNALVPSLSAGDAILRAASHLGSAVSNSPELKSQDSNRKIYTFNDCGIARNPIKVDLTLVNSEGQLRLAWNVSMEMRNSADWWNIRIDAVNGEFLSKNNWTVSCSFGDHTDANHANCAMANGAQIISNKNTTKVNGAAYNAFAFPLEAPNFGPRSLQIDQESLVASPFGWHDTDAADGAEFTITRGNNVFVYEDRNDDNQPGYSPDGGIDLNFDFPLDFTQSTLTNQDPIMTNLFYINNELHDILYQHGFDEVSGNFQANNYSKGGNGNDYVLAEAQDGSGTNNANFSTPGDGNNGRMQMYLWPVVAASLFNVNAPADIAGSYEGFVATLGAKIDTAFSGELVLAIDGTAPENDACQAIVNTAEMAGKIAVIDRGFCSFPIKVAAAVAAGAIAVILVNDVPAPPYAAGGNPKQPIPMVMISQADGAILKAKLSAGIPVEVTLGAGGSAVDARDASLDNGIIAHELGHGLSNRLTGGPSASSCLGNGEQGGEGWSDYIGMIMTIEPGDQGSDARPIGTYSLNQNGGKGIRRFPYSTSPSLNKQNYGDLVNSSGVHAIGEIWAQTLWDMTWKLIDAEGFDPDMFNGTGGNNTALRLVIEGMKLQPCGPGYVDGRDAILAADELLYNNAHRCIIWESFAGRGLGFFADQGSADSSTDQIEDNSIPPFCQVATAPPTADFTVNVVTSCYGEFKFSDKSSNTPQSWLWEFGDGNTSDKASPLHQYLALGNYAVTLTVTNTLGTSQKTTSVSYQLIPAPSVTGETGICIGASTTLSATVDAGNIATWSQNNNIVFVGNSFITPVLNATTFYTVSQGADFPAEKVGPLDNTFGSGSNHGTGFLGQLLFEAYKGMTLVSVKVYAQDQKERTFLLFNNAGDVIDQKTILVPNGESRVDLNFFIAKPGFYRIGNASQDLYRNNAGASFPYEIGDLVRIYSSNASGNPLNFYYYFYDWEVKEQGCAAEAGNVVVNVSEGPVAAFSPNATELVVNFTDNSSGTPTTWSWNFGDGSAVSTEQNPTHTYAAAGTYTVLLTVGNGSCVANISQEITVEKINSTSNVNLYNSKLYPNPATNQVILEFFNSSKEGLRIDFIDALGKTLISRKLKTSENKTPFEISAFPAGVYNVKLTGKSGIEVKQLTVIK